MLRFAKRGAAHNVHLHRTGVKHFRHPAVGLLDLMFEAMALEADEGLTYTAYTAYTAEPGTSSHDGLKLLASWAAPHKREDNPKGSRRDRTRSPAT